jgi:glutaredoxin-like protein NrdH
MPAVTVFTTGPSCQMCRLTKMQMDRRGIMFEEVRLDEQPELAEKVRELGFTQAPVVLVDDDDIWDGFRSEAIDQLAWDIAAA